MSGHNKWTQIKRQKGAADAKKSKLFSILAREITIAAKQAGGDKNHPGLRKVIERARAANMPNENVERAISKASGAGEASLEEVIYEAYGPGGVALIIAGITDNKNRTGQEIKHLLAEHGATLATPGAALWAFNKQGEDYLAAAPVLLGGEDQEKLADLVGVLENHDDVKKVYTNIGH